MKKKWKYASLLLATSLVLAACTEKEEEVVEKEQEVVQKEEPKVEVDENVVGENKDKYLMLEGKTSNEEERTDGTKYLTVGEVNVEYGVLVTNDVNVYDVLGEKTELNVGENFKMYYRTDRPMLMIYPPQYSPDIIIVEKDGVEGFYEKVTIEKDGVTKDGRFKLNVLDEVKVVSVKGEELTDRNIEGKEVIFFYDVSTRSIPAQVTPKKIIVLD